MVTGHDWRYYRVEPLRRILVARNGRRKGIVLCEQCWCFARRRWQKTTSIWRMWPSEFPNSQLRHLYHAHPRISAPQCLLPSFESISVYIILVPRRECPSARKIGVTGQIRYPFSWWFFQCNFLPVSSSFPSVLFYVVNFSHNAVPNSCRDSDLKQPLVQKLCRN